MKKILWKPPRLRIGEGAEGERHATWLEQFYDLLFAAVRFILVGEYLGAHVWVPASRPLTRRFGLGFGLAAAIWTPIFTALRNTSCLRLIGAVWRRWA